MKILIGGLFQFVGMNGGVERVLVNFANEMHKRGHNVSLLYCTEVKGNAPYVLNPEVHLINLIRWVPCGQFESKQKNLLFKIRRELLRLFNKNAVKNENTRFILNKLGNAAEQVLQEEKPDVFVSIGYTTTAAFVEVAERQGIPIITMTHIDAGSAVQWMSEIERKAVDRSDALQVLMPHDIDLFQRVLSKVSIKWIPNIVPQFEINNGEKEKVIINVARLAKSQKRQHLLINSFAKIAKKFPEWRVEIWGNEDGAVDGQYTRELKTLINSCHLNERIKLCGRTDDVLAAHRRASIFAFPSAYEGFPLAMTEAMSAGLPVVAYRSCPAVNELVRDGETGLLVDDGVDALAEGLKKLMEDQELRERMGRAAHESMKEFAPEKIWNQWEALMQDVIAKHKMKMER